LEEGKHSKDFKIGVICNKEGRSKKLGLSSFVACGTWLLKISPGGIFYKKVADFTHAIIEELSFGKM